MADDEELLARVGRGDAEAFTLFYRRHVDGLVGFAARRCGSAVDAADLVADVFLAVVGSAVRFDASRVSARAWLYGVANHVAAQRGRRARRDRALTQRLAGRRLLDEDDVARLEARIDAERQARELVAAVDALSSRVRAVVLLVDVDGLTPAEAAAPWVCRPRMHAWRCRAGAAACARWSATPAHRCRSEVGRMGEVAFEDRLLEELRSRVGSSGEAGSGRRTGLWVGAVGALVLVLVAGAVLWPRSLPAAFAVEPQADGRVAVQLLDLFDDPVGAQASLEAAGLAVAVEHPAGSPSVVGKVTNVLVEFDQPGVEVGVGAAGIYPGDTDEIFSATLDPAVFEGVVTLLVPRAARADELPTIAYPAFSAGDVLGDVDCPALGWPVAPAQIATLAAERGMPVVWDVITGFDGPATAFDPTVEQPASGWVVGAMAASAGTPGAEPGGLEVIVLPEELVEEGEAAGWRLDPSTLCVGR